jgi:hypothetical protein
MPYTINRYNGTVVTTVADGTVDTTTDLKFIGKNYAGYGEIQNENFLFLLENFSNPNPPSKPLSGQVWYDSTNSKLKFYDSNKWRTTGGAEVSPTQPTGLTIGDFWFDTANNQLYAWSATGGENNGPGFVLVGPQGVAGSGTTQMISRSVKEAGSNATHAIIEARVGTGIGTYQTVYVISPDSTFTLDSTNTITGFTKIHQGLTLAYTNNDSGDNIGVTTDSHRFWGTATNSDKLGGYDASSYIRTGSAIFNTLVQFDDVGFTVGATPKLRVFNSSNTTPTIQNQLNDTIVFQTTVSSVTKTPMKLVGNDIVPGADANTSTPSNIGSNALKFATVYANTFNGTATKADSLAVSGEYKTASSASSVGTIVARTSVDEVLNGTTITAGAVKGTFFVGTATAANYADLAEKYLADKEYEVGTVVMIGGEKEVTAAEVGFRAIGAVSEKPAYLMNFELEGGTPVALKGRVPVKVNGSVIKGQRLVAGPSGTAQAAMGNNADTFAIALETSTDAGVKLVECLIL